MHAVRLRAEAHQVDAADGALRVQGGAAGGVGSTCKRATRLAQTSCCSGRRTPWKKAELSCTRCDAPQVALCDRLCLAHLYQVVPEVPGALPSTQHFSEGHPRRPGT